MLICQRRDQRGRCCTPHASVSTLSPLLDIACSAPQRLRSSRAKVSWFTPAAPASVCGSLASLRSDSTSLNAPLRRRSTSARRRQTEAVYTTRAIGRTGASHLFTYLGLNFELSAFWYQRPDSGRRDQGALRSAARAIGHLPASRPTTPVLLHSARFRRERDSFVMYRSRGYQGPLTTAPGSGG